jgi:hypothetical protein
MDGATKHALLNRPAISGTRPPLTCKLFCQEGRNVYHHVFGLGGGRSVPPPELCGGTEALFAHTGFARQQRFFSGTAFAKAFLQTQRGISANPLDVVSSARSWQGEEMKPLELAARFAAFAWYTNNLQATSRITQVEARRFSNRNWRIFLPVARKGWGRLLLRVAKARPNSQRPDRIVEPVHEAAAV